MVTYTAPASVGWSEGNSVIPEKLKWLSSDTRHGKKVGRVGLSRVRRKTGRRGKRVSFFLLLLLFFFVLAGFRGFVEVARGAGFGRGNTWSRMLWPCLGDAVTVIQAHTAHHEAGVKRKLPSRRSVASLSETPCCPVLPLGPPFSPFLNSPGKSPAFPATASAVHHA